MLRCRLGPRTNHAWPLEEKGWKLALQMLRTANLPWKCRLRNSCASLKFLRIRDNSGSFYGGCEPLQANNGQYVTPCSPASDWGTVPPLRSARPAQAQSNRLLRSPLGPLAVGQARVEGRQPAPLPIHSGL